MHSILRRIRNAVQFTGRISVRALGRIVPKREGFWIIGGNRGLRYADNSMHFHRYCVAHGLDVAWFTRSRGVLNDLRRQGHRAYLVSSLPGLWHGLRATWHVFDVGPSDTGPTAVCAQRMNLWHGIPLKDTSFLKATHPAAPSPSDHFSHPNRRHAQDIMASFPLHEANIALANLPRNRVFSADYDAKSEAKTSDLEWVKRLEKERSNGKLVVGYFPTWRGNGRDLFLGATKPEEIQRLAAYLHASPFVLATKWHTCSFKEYRHHGESRTAAQIDAKLSTVPQVVTLPFELDLNTILPQCDVLVTDYSSVFFDFALSDRPQIFLPYDLEEYEASMGFFYEYRSMVPGRIVRDIDGLIDELESFRIDSDAYRSADAAKRATVRSEFFETSESSPRIVAYMRDVDAGVQTILSSAQQE